MPEATPVIDRPDTKDLSQCVHCGFCLQQCPTYLQLGIETDSPRGRIHLIRAVAEERVEPTGALAKHLDLCLQCRACETACPSSVPFGRIMEASRAMVVQRGQAPLSWRLRAALLRSSLPYPKRLAALFALLRLVQRTGLARLLRSHIARRLLPRALTEAATLLPYPPPHPFEMPSPSEVTAARRVALLTGCVMPLLYPRTHEATVRVLARNGVATLPASDQCCCGALSAHAGDLTTARELARRNIDALLAAEVEAVVVNSAGCGAALKEYGHLLASDPTYADKANRLSAMVQDISEYLVSLPFQPPNATVRERVTYQDSCHLAHAQRVRAAPRDLLRAIPGIDLVELATPDRCCGSAGIYSFAQREMSMRLLDDKMRDVASTGATTIATANPGCMMQLEAGLRRHGLPGRVVHVVELLDEAYRAEEASL